MAFLVGFMGMLMAGPPTYRVAKRLLLQLQAKHLWDAYLAEKEIKSGGAFVWLQSESGHLNNLVVWDATEENLQNFPAWSTDSAMPGEKGLGIVFGHRDSHFRKLGALKLGERVMLATKERELNLKVSFIQILPKDQLAAGLSRFTQQEGVVLITCYPFRYAGPAPQRYLVWLEPVNQTPAPSFEQQDLQAKINAPPACLTSGCSAVDQMPRVRTVELFSGFQRLFPCDLGKRRLWQLKSKTDDLPLYDVWRV